LFPEAVNGFAEAVNRFPEAVNGFPEAVNGFPEAVNPNGLNLIGFRSAGVSPAGPACVPPPGLPTM